MLTFQPQITKPEKATKTPRRINEKQASNFWERNLAFMTQKANKSKKLDQRVNKDVTFKPAILPKSREISLNRG